LHGRQSWGFWSDSHDGEKKSPEKRVEYGTCSYFFYFQQNQNKIVMGMIKEFKEFAVRGNLVDTAVAFVMGASFGKIVSSFVDGMVMPVVGMLTGGVDFNDKKLILKEATPEVKDAAGKVVEKAILEVSVKYGSFLTNLIDFIIVAFAVFLVIKAINKLKKKEEEAPAAPPAPSSTDQLLIEIRDALKK
jgi:large conductance mechanosensitive channel